MTNEQKSTYLKSIQQSVAALNQYISSTKPPGTASQSDLNLAEEIVRYYEAESADRAARRRWRWVAFLMALLAGAAVAAYAVVAARTLEQVRLQVGTIETQLRQSVESFRRDERAWVELEPVKPMFVVPQDDFATPWFHYDLYLKNIGKTVADDITVRAIDARDGIGLAEDAAGVQAWQVRLQEDQVAAGATNYAFFPTNRVPKLLAPGGVTPAPIIVSGAGPRNKLHQYIMGRVSYTDAFSVSHWTTFCFVVTNSRGELAYCKGGNDQDRNPENPPR